MRKIALFNILLINLIYAECSDLDFSLCIQYSQFCDWNEETSQCQDIGSGEDNSSYIEPSCIPFDQIDPIPYNTTEYATMCMEYLGVPPVIDCGEGVHIPIYVNGQEVYEDQPSGACDDTDFKGTCNVGSRVGRIEGSDINGNPIPDCLLYTSPSPRDRG